VRAVFENGARGANGIFDALKAGDGAGAESGGVHDDGVAFNAASKIEMRAEAGVEDGIVFEDGDGGLDGVEGVAALGENRPASFESAEAAGFAGVNGVVGDVPSAAMKNERRFHALGELQKGREFV